MKVEKSATKFIFTIGDSNLVKEAGYLIDFICDEINENETFLGQDKYDIQNIVDFFSDFIKAIEKGIDIDDEVTIECEKM